MLFLKYKIKSEQIPVISKNPLKKFDTLIGKNIGFKTIKNISNILEVNATSWDNTISEELMMTWHMKFEPKISVDVERSFLRYITLANNCWQFIFENI